MDTIILDFVKCVILHVVYIMPYKGTRASKAHTGTYLAARISECLHDFGIAHKVGILFCVGSKFM